MIYYLGLYHSKKDGIYGAVLVERMNNQFVLKGVKDLEADKEHTLKFLNCGILPKFSPLEIIMNVSDLNEQIANTLEKDVKITRYNLTDFEKYKMAHRVKDMHYDNKLKWSELSNDYMKELYKQWIAFEEWESYSKKEFKTYFYTMKSNERDHLIYAMFMACNPREV